MHLLLTDALTCPRCGPRFGLVLLADRIEARRVFEGHLGCPNCRDRFPISGGFADLRAPPRPPLDSEKDAPDSGVDAPDGEAHPGTSLPIDEPGRTDPAVALGGLLGVTTPGGHVLLVGAPSRHAEALADLLDHVEVVASARDARDRPERDGVSRMVTRPGLPFRDGAVRGVALGAGVVDALCTEAARVAAPGARVVAFGGPHLRAIVEAAGLSILAAEGDVVVARR